MNDPITVETTINAPREKVWRAHVDPEAMKEWGHASDDWHTVAATNDPRPGGAMSYRMEAKDGSAGFDLTAVYNDVAEPAHMAYTMGDGRKVMVDFEEVEGGTHVVTRFEPEHENPRDMQRGGWQAILDNFKEYVESH